MPEPIDIQTSAAVAAPNGTSVPSTATQATSSARGTLAAPIVASAGLDFELQDPASPISVRAGVLVKSISSRRSGSPRKVSPALTGNGTMNENGGVRLR